MAHKFTDSWDSIQEALLIAGGEPNQRRQARDAFEIKAAIETIEQQKAIVSLQETLLEYQKEVGRQAIGLTKATWALVIFTGLLFISTIFSIISSNMSSNRQAEAIKNLSSATSMQAKSVKDLNVALKGIHHAITVSPIEEKDRLSRRPRR